jgi:NaMN:DMB phosphoribosyltransferase
MSIIDAAAKTLSEMATFASAGVSEALDEECEHS